MGKEPPEELKLAIFKNWLDTRPKMETHEPNVYPTILGGVSRGFWSPFEDLGTQSAIFWYLTTRETLSQNGGVKSIEDMYFKSQSRMIILGPLATDPPGKLDILGHDGHPLGVDGTEVGVLKETHQVGLASLLKSHHSRALEPQVSLEVLSNLANKALEWQFADEQFSRLLVPMK